MAIKSNSQRSAEFVKKMKEKEDEEKKISSTENTTSESRSYSNSERSRRFQLNQSIGLDTLETDLSELGSTINNISNGWQTPETMANTLSSVQSMYDRLGKYGEYQKMFGGADLTELTNTYKSVIDNWGTISDRYKGFKSAEEYNKTIEYNEGLKTADIGAIEEDISKLESILGKANEYQKSINSYIPRKGVAHGEDKKAQDNAKSEYDAFLKENGYSNYAEVRNALEEKKIYRNEAKSVQDTIARDKKENEMASSKEAAEGWKKWETYKTDRQKAKAEEKPSFFEEYASTPAYDGNFDFISMIANQKRENTSYQEPKDDWTQEERNIFGAYFLENPEDAYDYAARLNNAKALAEKEKGKQKHSGEATSGFWAGAGKTALSILSSPLHLADYVDDVTDIAAGRRTIVEEGYVTPLDYSQAVTGGITNKLNEFGTLTEDIPVIGGKGWGDVYSLGTNIVQSRLSLAALGEVGTLVSYFGQGAASAVDDAIARGATSEQALQYGTLVGLAEGVSEKIGIDSLLKLNSATTLKGLLTNVAKQGGAEGFEGFVSSTAEKFADAFVMKDKSNFNLTVNKLVSSGMSVEEAKKKAFNNTVEEVAFDTLMEAASGAIGAVPETAMKTIGQHSYNKSMGEAIRGNERVGDMLDLANNPEIATAYEAYTRYAKKGVNADNISNAQLGNLYYLAKENATETFASKKATAEQKMSAIETLNKLGKIKEEDSALKKAKANTVKGKENASNFEMGEVTEVTATGNSAKIEGIKVEGENTTLITSEGEMSASEMTFNQRDSELVGHAQYIATEYGNDVGNVFLNQYDGNTEVEEYAKDFNLVMEYAKENTTEDIILNHKGVLTTEQAKAIYNATVHQHFQAQDDAVNAIVEKQGKNMTIKGTFDDSIVDYDGTTTDGSKVNWKTLTSRQREAIKFARMFSKATGVNIRLIQSKVVNGKRKGENGSYDPNTNTISIDVYAGINDAVVKHANDSIIPTLSHEITHWAKYKSPAIYNVLREDVMRTLAENGTMTSEERIEAEIARLKKNHPDQEFTSEDAIDELVAKSCEDMLSNSNAARKLLNKMTPNEQKKFLAKLKETFENLMQWVNDLLAQYKSNSEEAKILREYKYKLQRISKTWDKMLTSAIEANQALQKEGVIAENLVNGISKDGTTIVGEKAIQMSERTYAEGGRDFLESWLNNQSDLSKDDIKDILDQTDAIAGLMKSIREGNELPEYSKWANMEVVKDETGEKILSVIVKNGDYAMNIDFSQVCKKRVALNAVLNAMVQSGDLNVYTLTETDVADLNAIIKKHEFEIACALCFVDSKRYRVGSWAESFCEGTDKKKNGKMVHQYGFNEMVRSLVPKGSNIKIDEFNFTGRDIVGQPTTNLLSEADDSELDFSLLDEIIEKEYKPDGKSTDLYAYAKAIKDNKDIRKILNPAEIISSIGLDNIRLEKPEIYRLINRHQGTARPKFSHDIVAYGNDILKAKNFTAEKAKMVGGVRCQSFSDFMANMVMDYAQFVSELSAKQLTCHTYTKEPLFVKLFGLTGIKINMSLVPKAIDMTPEQQKKFAILKDKNANKRSVEYKKAKEEYEKLAVNAGLDENGNYIWEDETFPYDIAMELVVDPRYSANCGTIAVGISDRHILKLLGDDRISMVIPYHKSGLNHEVAVMRDIALYKDYTKTQSTRFANGKKLEGVPDFNFYGDLYGIDGKEGTHDPKKTAENYLKWCDEHNYIPKFEKSINSRTFRDNPNYYKLLIDFRVYDTDGTYREQQSVTPTYPSNDEFKDLILNGVKDKNGKVYGGLLQQQGVTDKLSTESQQIIDEYRKVLKDKYGKDVLKKQYSNRDAFLSEEDYDENCRELVHMKSVADLIGTELDGDKPLRQKISELFKSWGGTITTDRFGTIAFGESSIRSEIRHGTTRAKMTSYAAIPQVLNNGVVIDIYEKNRGEVKRIVIAAPITISNTPYFMGVEIQRDINTNRLYLHDVVIKKEASYYQAQHLNTTGTVDKENLFITDVLEKAISVGYSISQSPKKVKGKFSDRDSDRVTDITEEDYKKMVNHFGVTGNFNVAGYMLKNGKLLDFSGKHWGATTSRTRQVDHRDIQEVLPDKNNGVDSMVNMISNGNIRLMPETGGINLAVALTKNQRILLRRYIEYMSPKEGIIVDIDKVGGDTIKSFTYENGVSADRVIRDIDNYFRGVRQSELMRFHTAEGDGILYSDRNEDISVYEKMGEMERILKENEKFKADVERLKERLELERKVTHGNYFNENQLTAVAGHLRNIAKSTYDKKILVESLRGIYSYIAHSPEVYWEELFDMCYAVADSMLAESKQEVEVNDYYKRILKDIKKARISLDSVQKAEAEHRFGKNYNRYFFGKVTLANDGIPLDTQWQEWAHLYPTIFNSESTDQINDLLDIYDTLQEASETVVEYDIEEKTRWLANEIYNQYWNVSTIKTTADKYDRQIRLLNFEHRRIMTELRENYNTRLKEQHKADKEKYNNLAQKIRERKDQEISKAKELGRERLAKYRENAERKTINQRIASNILALKDLLVKNSKDKHVPEVMKPVVASLVKSMDFSSRRMLDKGIPTQKDISLYKALSDVKDMMADFGQGENALGEIYGLADAEVMKEMVDKAYHIKEELGDNEHILANLSLEELKTIDTSVRAIRHIVNQANAFHIAQYNAGVKALGEMSIDEINSRKKIYEDDVEGKKHFEMLNTKVVWNNKTPWYAFKQFGKMGQVMFRALQDGQDKLDFLSKEIVDFANKQYSAKEYKEWRDTYFDFEIRQPDGKMRKFSMNVPQILSLYCVTKQEDGKRHILFGNQNEGKDFGEGKGITLVETKERSAIRTNIVLTETDLKNIIKKLDKVPKAKEAADKMQEYMGTRGAELGNEISMARWGIKSFGIKDYFPIKVSDGRVSGDDTPGVNSNSLLKLLNMSFTHSRNKFAKQSVEIGDFFDVFAYHMSDMARYNALALPILDMYKWMKYQDKNSLEERSVQTSIKNTFGDFAWEYVRKLMEDLNGSSKSDTRDNMSVKVFKRSKTSKVGFNQRVMALQGTSLVRAGAVMDNKYLLKSFTYDGLAKRGYEKAYEHCGMVVRKAMGFFDTDITKSLTEKIKHETSVLDKAVDTSLKGAELADKITIGLLWNACELEIRDTRKDLKVGSEEFYKEVGLRLRDVIYATQVVDSPLTRSQMMRSKSMWDKILTAFMSESTLSLNLITDAFISQELDSRSMGKEKAWEKNKKYIRKSVTAYIVTAMATSLVGGLVDALRDDEEEKDAAYFAKLFGTNFFMDMSLVNKIPYLNIIYSILQGYTPSRSDTDWITDIVKVGRYVLKGDAKAWKYMLKLLSDASGVGVYNIYRDIKAYIDLFED